MICLQIMDSMTEPEVDQSVPLIGPPRHPADAMKAIQSHPGSAAVERRNSITRTYQMFWANVEDLGKWLRVFENPNVAPLLIHRGGYEEPGDAMEEYGDELLRLWFNYAASATALVEHAEKLAEDETEEFQAEFARRNKLVRHTPVEELTRGLRNILLHRGWPSYMFQFDLGPGQSHGLFCDAEQLLGEYDRWQKNAKAYLVDLAARGEAFSLRQSIESFADAIDRFYEWYWDAQTEEHAGAFVEIYHLHEEYERMIPTELPLRQQLAEERRSTDNPTT